LGNKAYNKIKLGEQDFMSFAKRDGWTWMDGTFVPWRDATVHVLTHTLHYGSGVFEGVRAYQTDHGTAVFRLGEHTERLLMSAKILGMTVPYDAKTLNDAQTQLLAMNHLAEGYIRPLAFFGSQTMGVPALANKVSVAIACWPWGKYLGEEALELGIRVHTSSFTRISRRNLFGRAKAS
jgi:branched-chain amino acid aminotransferase